MMPNDEKKRRLLCESMFIPIKIRTSILKMAIREVSLRNQSINIIYLNEENVFMMSNHEKIGDYFVNPCLLQLKDVLQF